MVRSSKWKDAALCRLRYRFDSGADHRKNMEREPGRPGDRLLSESYPKGIRFEFCALRQNHGSVAQLAEHPAFNRVVAGSNPVAPTIWVSRLAAMAADCKSAGFTIVGSSPT